MRKIALIRLFADVKHDSVDEWSRAHDSNSEANVMAKKTAPASKAAASTRKAPAKTAAAKAPAPKSARGASAARTTKQAGTGAPSTVTLRQLAARLAEDHEMAKRQADAVLSGLVGLVVDHLKNGDRIRIGGLGILQVRSRAARQGRNPATGEAITIKASRKIAFRPAKELKEAI